MAGPVPFKSHPSCSYLSVLIAPTFPADIVKLFPASHRMRSRSSSTDCAVDTVIRYAPNGPKYTVSTWTWTQGRASPCVAVSAAADLVCEAPETISTARSQTISPFTVAGGGGGVVELLHSN